MVKILINETNSWLVDVSEAITSKNLHDFVFLQLEENGIEKDSRSQFFYTYLKECQKYFLAHYYCFGETSYIQPQILKAYFLENSLYKTSSVLFILEEYFAIYKNEELLFFKPTKQKVSSKQIENFVERGLKQKIDTYIEIDEKQKNELEKIFEKNYNSLKKLRVLKNNHYKELKKFLALCLLCLVTLVATFSYKYIKKDEKNSKQTVTIYSPKRDLISQKILFFTKNIDSFGLEMQSMRVNNERLYFYLKHPNKAKLIEFLTLYKGEIKTLNYNAQEKTYELNALFKLS